MESNPKLNIVQRLSGIRKMAAAVKKSASGYNYTYSPEDEVLANVTAGMNKYGVGLHISIDPNFNLQPIEYEKTKRDKSGNVLTEKVREWLLTGVMKMTWVNEDDPTDNVTSTWLLIGQQADASQAFGAALTYCNRYFMLKYFQSATTKDDPDNYRSKQKAAEERENVETAKAIVASMHEAVSVFLTNHPEAKDGLVQLIKANLRINGKQSADYFKIVDTETAAKLQTAVLNYIETNSKSKSKKGE